MAFWSSTATSEPRRNFKFLVRISDANGLIPTWVVKGINLPEINVGESEHKFLNHTFYFPGTVTYNEITFTVVDSINDEISQRVLAKFANSGYNIPTEEGLATESLMTKNQSVGSLGNVTIEHLGSGEDGQDGIISFALTNAWIKKVQFGQSLAYDSEDLSEISMTLRYDFFNFYNGSTAVPSFGA